MRDTTGMTAGGRHALVFWRAVVSLYTTLLVVGSLWPHPHHLATSFWEELLQNSLHFFAYAGLAFLLLIPLQDSGNPPRRYGRAVAFCFLLGILLEIVQGQIPGRSPSWLDVGLNTAGILAAVWSHQKRVIAARAGARGD